MLMQEHPEIIYGLFVLLLLTDIIGGFFVALPFIRVAQKIFKNLDFSLFFPGVVVCCVVGVYAEEFNIFNLRIFLALGFVGLYHAQDGHEHSADDSGLYPGTHSGEKYPYGIAAFRGKPDDFHKKPHCRNPAGPGNCGIT